MTDPQATAQPLPQGHAVGPELIYSTRERDAAIREEGRQSAFKEAAEIARAKAHEFRLQSRTEARDGKVDASVATMWQALAAQDVQFAIAAAIEAKGQK